MKKDSQTIIPSNASKEKEMHKSPKNIKYVNTYQGGNEQSRATKAASVKHENQDYFSKQKSRT